MNRYQYYLCTILLASAVVFNGQAQQKPIRKKPEVKIAFYNVENLFDTEDDAITDDSEFLPNGKYQWDATRYQNKLKNLNRVMDSMFQGSAPDVMGFCEIENKRVVEDVFAYGNFKNSGMKVLHQESDDPRGIDVALAYNESNLRLSKVSWLKFSFPEKPDFKMRAVLMAEFFMQGTKLVVLVNHLPSKRNGDENENIRKQIISKERGVYDSLVKSDPNIRIVAMGDWNATAKELSSNFGYFGTPLANVPWGPMQLFEEAGEGTHYYDKQWHCLDQFVMTPNLEPNSSGWVVKSGYPQIVKKRFMLETEEKYAGSPLRTFVGRNAKYVNGFSDHLPIVTVLTINKPEAMPGKGSGIKPKLPKTIKKK